MKIVLPASWDGVTFDQYQQIIDIVKPDAVLTPMEQLDLNIQILSIFTGVAVDSLEGLSMNRIGELMNRLHWMDQPIKRKKATFKVKDIDGITYDMFVHFNKLAETKTTNQIEYLSLFVDIPKEELKQKPITEIMHGFFLLNRKYNRYTICSAISLMMKRIIWAMKRKKKRKG